MENCIEETQTDNDYGISLENIDLLSEDKEDKYSPEKLEMLKNKIEKMEKLHHIKILHILKKYNGVKLNENKSGVFINLTFLPKNTIDELYEYAKYVEIQEYSILDLETKQDEYKILLEKEDKEITLSYDSLSNKLNV